MAADMAALGTTLKAWMPANGKRAVGRNEVHFNVLHFGAVRGTSTDSSPGFNAAIAAIIANGGGRLYIPSGQYKLASSLNPITVPTTIYGDGAGTDGSGKGSTILTNDGVSVFSFSADRCAVEGIYFLGPAGSTTVTTSKPVAIRFTAGAFQTVKHCGIRYFYDGVRYENCDYQQIHHNDISWNANYGLFIANAATPDAGDGSLTENTFRSAASGTWAGVAQVHQESSGGIKATANKFIDGPTGYEVAIADGADTSILTIAANSFETHHVAHVRFISGGTANTGVFSKIAITGNQFSPWNVSEGAISAQGAAGQYQSCNVTGNVMNGTNGTSTFFNIKNFVMLNAQANSLSYGLTELVDGGGNDTVIMDNVTYSVTHPVAGTAPAKAIGYYKNYDTAANAWGAMGVIEVASATTLKLPSLAIGRQYTVVNTGSAACAVSSSASGEMIKGAATYSVPVNGSATFFYAGGHWLVIAAA